MPEGRWVESRTASLMVLSAGWSQVGSSEPEPPHRPPTHLESHLLSSYLSFPSSVQTSQHLTFISELPSGQTCTFSKLPATNLMLN